MTEIRKDMLEPGGWFRIQADESARTATLHIYGTIGHSMWWDDVSSPELVRELDALDVDEITLRINSPGGFARDGVAIMNALVRHKAKVIATVDGLAASAATVVLLAADEVAMGAGSELMIHDAWNIAIGQASDLRKVADQLDATSQTIAGLYAQRAGGTAEEWRAAMVEETWYTAEEAVEAGFAHRVLTIAASDTTTEDDASNVVPIDRAARAFGWQHAGRAAADAPFIPGRGDRRAPAAAVRGGLRPGAAAQIRPSASSTANDPTTVEGGPTMSDAFTQEVRERLDLSADTGEDRVLAALDERLAAPASSAALPEGVVTIEREQLASLQADAAAGRDARNAQIESARAAAVDAAVQDGRISPSRREHWMSALEADPGAEEVLNKLSKGLVPLEAKGHTGGIDEAPDEDAALYSKAWGDPAAETTKEA